eukprot:34758-Rhodomonas_salina.3
MKRATEPSGQEKGLRRKRRMVAALRRTNATRPRPSCALFLRTSVLPRQTMSSLPERNGDEDKSAVVNVSCGSVTQRSRESELRTRARREEKEASGRTKRRT